MTDDARSKVRIQRTKRALRTDRDYHKDDIKDYPDDWAKAYREFLEEELAELNKQSPPIADNDPGEPKKS